jgi:Ran GTPase-activating protein (RanGAP) involved in mRNA processing and transport
LFSDFSQITKLEIRKSDGGLRMMGLTHVLQALARRPTLTKLGLDGFRLNPNEVTDLGIALCGIPSLQSLELASIGLGSTELAEVAPALYHNTSIKVLDMSDNNLNSMEAAEILRDIIRSNKTITTLDLSENTFGRTTGAVDCIVVGLGSNSTLLKIDLSHCDLRSALVSTLARKLGSRNTTLQKLSLKDNGISSTGVCVLLDTMEHGCHITDLDLENNRIGNKGARLLARSLGNNACPSLPCLSRS